MTLNGNAGVLFDVTDSQTTATGTVEQVMEVPVAIGQLEITESDIAYSVSGSVSTTAFDFDLNNINNQSGTGYSTVVIRNNDGNFTTLKQIVVYNTHATQTIVLGASSANNLFTWNATNNGITIEAGESKTFTYSAAKTIGSNGKFNLVGSGSTTTFKIWVLGT